MENELKTPLFKSSITWSYDRLYQKMSFVILEDTQNVLYNYVSQACMTQATQNLSSHIPLYKSSKKDLPADPQELGDRLPFCLCLRKLHPGDRVDVSPSATGTECAPSPCPLLFSWLFRVISTTTWFWFDVPKGFILRDNAPSFTQGARISAHYCKNTSILQNELSIVLVDKALSYDMNPERMPSVEAIQCVDLQGAQQTDAAKLIPHIWGPQQLHDICPTKLKSLVNWVKRHHYSWDRIRPHF